MDPFHLVFANRPDWAWKRAIEIGLSIKRKLGFVKGIVVRSATDANLVELKDTCNNMQLERRFYVSYGSRKYMLNKDTCEITQSGSSIGDYFTKTKCVWDELDSLNTLPVIVRITHEITAFLTALSKQKEEQRGTWVYLFEHKSESFEALKYFLKFVCTQFGEQVKIVRSDNALEFVKGQCGPYLTSHGIVHQTSYVDRPQQNGRAERKHKHILDTARALRFHSKLPLKFWVINRLPSSNNPPVPNTPSIPQTTNVPSRKSTRTKILPPKLKDFVLHHTPRANQVSQTPLVLDFQDFISALLAQQYPLNFKQAIADPEWCGVVNAELRALENNGTWELTQLPPEKKAIGSHWIYKTKLKADGTEDKKKARLVVQGNRQKHGVDYKETFAHVAKIVTLRSLLAVVAVKGWFTCQMDKSNAFLHGDLFEEVYMRPPQGYAGQGRDVSAEKALDQAKKQAVVSRSYAKSEYRAMALTCCEVTWLVSLFKDLGITNLKPVDLHYDNQAALYIVANLVFHAGTKHIEVDCHFVRDRLKSGKINPSYVNTKEQLVDVSTKVITVEQHNKLLSKLRVLKPTNSQLEGECESTKTKVR
nr:retrovirus-related Pol polyprotein from transposon TNT 1-94 [Tanacetum cinerariifolium]